MDGYLEILVFLLSVCQGLCLNGTLLYFNGCMPERNLTTPENNSVSHVQHNYPALCLQHCIETNYYKPVAIALQNTKCVCLNRTNHVLKLGGSTNCSELCPGHRELYCGSKAVNSYSVYGTIYNTIGMDEEELCAANFRGTRLRIMLNCSHPNPTFCHKKDLDGSCKEIKPASNWSQELQTCPIIKPQYNLYGNETIVELCKSSTTDSNGFLSTENATFWIPAFGQYAPKIECGTLPGLMNGNATSQDNPRFVKYSCKWGYELLPKESSTRFCETNGNWNGTDPTCRKLGTTTSQAVNNVTGPLTTGLTTGINAATPKQTSAVTKPPAESKSDTRTTVTVGIIVGVIGFLLFCAVLAAGVIFYCKHKRKLHKVAPANSYGTRNMEEDDNQGLSTVRKSSL